MSTSTAKLTGTSPEVLDRTPPYNLDAEAGVIGSIILDSSKLDDIAGTVRAADFHDHRNRELFGHFLAMRRAGDGIDVTLLFDRLKANGDFGKCGGSAYLAEIMNAVPVAAHAAHYARIVREKAVLRSLRHSFADGLREIASGQTSSAALVRQTRAALELAADASQTNDFGATTCADLMLQEFDEDFVVDRILVAAEPAIIADKVPKFGDPEHVEALRALILDREISVLAIDPLYFCVDSDNQANLSAQGEQLRSIAEMCNDTGVTLLLCHHTRKETSRTYEPLDLSCITGAGYGEFARQWILLSRREAYGPGTGVHALWMAVGGSYGHGGLWGLDVDEGLILPAGEHPNQGKAWLTLWLANLATPALTRDFLGSWSDVEGHVGYRLTDVGRQFHLETKFNNLLDRNRDRLAGVMLAQEPFGFTA